MTVIVLGIMHMLIHEIGHVVAALSVGSKIKKIGLHWRGPYIIRSPASTPWRNASVALAGPGVNLLTWAILAVCHLHHAWVALFIACFNLLPMPHSDLTKCLGYLKRDHAPISNAARSSDLRSHKRQTRKIHAEEGNEVDLWNLTRWISPSILHRVPRRRRVNPDVRLKISNLTHRAVLACRVEVADHGAARRKGLLGRDHLSVEEGLWISPCEAVHTVGMQFPIDLVYLDRNMRVKKVRSDVPPWRLSACLSAHSVLELASGTIRRTQTKPGDRLESSSADPLTDSSDGPAKSLESGGSPMSTLHQQAVHLQGESRDSEKREQHRIPTLFGWRGIAILIFAFAVAIQFSLFRGSGFFVFLVSAAVGGTVTVATCFDQRNVERNLFLLFAGILLAASLASPFAFVPAGLSMWSSPAFWHTTRSWFVPALAVAWSLAWYFHRPE